ncbi:MAG: sodium-independent anion transporter [Gammaproteobacteria bacterium]|nr:MAG: sodium-independent anion transporter [Gammaproteobacteria bacterium]
MFHGFTMSNLKGDIYGGLTAAVVALPLALAMGVSSGAGPVAGLYGAIIVGFFAAIFGGTPSQISGPTGPMTVVMAAIFTQYTTMFADKPEYGIAVAFTVVIMGGLLQILFGVLKVGKYINLMPHPVVSGFMSGIGVIIILLQLAPLLGSMGESGPVGSAMAIPAAWDNLIPLALVLGLVSLLIVYFLPKSIGKFIPSPLLALIIGTIVLLVYSGFDINVANEAGKQISTIDGVRILGEIPTGLPQIIMPVIDFSLLVMMIKSAFILALLGSIDSLLTSLVADNITHTHHRSNKELIGQGIGNTIAGFFGGLPGAGATMRTVVNVRAGGLTPISGALHALVLLSIVLGAGAFAKYIPHAVLAGILIKVGTDIIDWEYLRQIHLVPKAGLVMMLVVLVVTVAVDLITAVALGMILASFVFMQRMVNLQLDGINIYKNKPEQAPVSSEGKEIIKKAGGDILMFHLQGPLTFAAARGMQKRLSIVQGDYRVLVLDLKDVNNIDFSSAKALIEMVQATKHSNDKQVLIVGTNSQVLKMLKQQKINKILDNNNFYADRLDALRTAKTLITE